VVVLGEVRDELLVTLREALGRPATAVLLLPVIAASTTWFTFYHVSATQDARKLKVSLRVSRKAHPRRPDHAQVITHVVDVLSLELTHSAPIQR